MTLIQPLADLTVCEGDIAQMEVKFSQENVEGNWLKNGKPVTATERVHLVIDRQTHKILIENTTKDDLGAYSFVVPAQEISTSAKLFVQSRSIHNKLQNVNRFLFAKYSFIKKKSQLSLQLSALLSH